GLVPDEVLGQHETSYFGVPISRNASIHLQLGLGRSALAERNDFAVTHREASSRAQPTVGTIMCRRGRSSCALVHSASVRLVTSFAIRGVCGMRSSFAVGSLRDISGS